MKVICSKANCIKECEDHPFPCPHRKPHTRKPLEGCGGNHCLRAGIDTGPCIPVREKKMIMFKGGEKNER